MADLTVARKNKRSLLLASEVLALKPPKTGRRTLREPGGLAYRITETGHRSWSLEIKIDGKFRRFTVGDGTMLLKDARAAAQALRAKALAGCDPVAEKRERRRAKAEEKHTPATVRDLVDAFGKAKGAELRSWPEMRRQIIVCFGDRLDVAPDKLSKAHARSVLDAAVARGAAISGKRATRYLSRIMNWATSRELIERNPLQGLALDELTRPEPPRKRNLSDSELRAVWAAAGEAVAPFGDLTKLYLLSALRRDELALARWSDLEGDVLIIPTTKTGEPHRLPLSGAAMAIIQRQPTSGQEFIFTGPSGRPLTDSTNWCRHRQRIQELSKTSGWTWHDLRRSARTLLGRSGCDDLVCELIMNHALPGKLRKTYNLYKYENEMRATMNRLAAVLLGIVQNSGAQVIPLRA